MQLKVVEGTLDQILIQYPKASELILRPESSMGITLFCKGWSKKHKRIHVCLYLHGEEPVAWFWAQHWFCWGESKYRRRRYLAWFFVREDKRRQGLGTKMFYKAQEIARKRKRPLLVERWDSRSISFFDTLNATDLC